MKITHLIVLAVVVYFGWRWYQGQQAKAGGQRSARTGMAA